jgi:hypothetical protein
MRYAIQHISNGRVIDYCETKEQATFWLMHYPVELVNTTTSSKVSVIYTEIGGPWGYGHQEESFTTYGGITKCMFNLMKWIQETTRTFGPDIREIKDFLRHCSLNINGQNKTEWFLAQVDKIKKETIFV